MREDAGRSEAPARVSTVMFVLLVGAMLAYGGCWSSARVVSARTPPSVLTFWRYALTAVSILAVFPLFGGSPRVNRRDFPVLLVGGALMFAYTMFFFAALKTGLAGAGGVLVGSISPVTIFLVTSLQRRKPPGPWQTAGLAGGVIGSFIFLRLWAVSWEALATGGNLLFLLCAVLWGFVTIYSRWAQARVPFMTYSFYLYVFAALPALVLALAAGGAAGLLPAGGGGAVFWLNMVYLAVLGTAFSTTVYFLASKTLGSRTAGSFMFLVPMSAVVIGWLLLGEVPGPATIVGGSLMTAAVWLINR